MSSTTEFIVDLAQAYGWTKLGRDRLRAPDGASIHVPPDGALRWTMFLSECKKVMRHGTRPPQAMKRLQELATKHKLTPDATRQLVADAVPAMGVLADTGSATNIAFDQLPPSAMVDTALSAVLAGDSAAQAEEVAPVGGGEGDSLGGTERVLVSRLPFRAHAGQGGKTYESIASYERIYSDSTKDYECVVCARSFFSPQAVASHRKVHVKGQSPQPKLDGYDPDWVPSANATARIRRLALEIEEAKASQNDTCDPWAIAQAIIQARVAKEGEHPDPEAEPLTAEEVLDRIARLVDRGEAPALKSRIVQLEESYATLMQQLEVERKAREAAEEWRETIKGLIAE